jgi:hypothetical protein
VDPGKARELNDDQGQDGIDDAAAFDELFHAVRWPGAQRPNGPLRRTTSQFSKAAIATHTR